MSDVQISFNDMTIGNKPAKMILFVGQLDETNVDHEAKKIYQVITEMAEPLLMLDFSALEYMNSKSIGYLTDWFTQASAKNGSIAIIAPKPNILDILKVVGITQIIQIYNTAEEARVSMVGTETTTPTQTASIPEPTTQQTTPTAIPTPLQQTANTESIEVGNDGLQTNNNTQDNPNDTTGQY